MGLFEVSNNSTHECQHCLQTLSCHTSAYDSLNKGNRAVACIYLVHMSRPLGVWSSLNILFHRLNPLVICREIITAILAIFVKDKVFWKCSSGYDDHWANYSSKLGFIIINEQKMYRFHISNNQLA